MKNYFEGCTTLDALKARYRIMAKELHPDLHPELGDEPMKELNAQFERLSERLSHVAADGRTEATAEQAEQARADADAYRAVIMQIIHLSGIEIELCGAWLWVSGETRAHKDALKAAGLRWSAKKSMWYWRPAEAARRFNRHNHSIDYIRGKYGAWQSTPPTVRISLPLRFEVFRLPDRRQSTKPQLYKAKGGNQL